MSASLENLEARIAQLEKYSAAQTYILEKIVAADGNNFGDFLNIINMYQETNLVAWRCFAQMIPDDGLRYKFIKNIEFSRSGLDQLQAMIEQYKRNIVSTRPAAGESAPLA